MSVISNMTPPEASSAEQSRMELQAKLNGLGGLNGRKLDPEAKAKKLREACEGFESIFIQKMWQEMRNTVPKSGLLSGKEEKFWQDMYDQELSKSMTSAGGIGLADMMYEQLSRGLASASSATAQTVSGGAFVPTAAPFIMPVEEAPLTASPASAMEPAAIYDGEAPQTASSPAVAPQAEEKTAPVITRPEHKSNLRHADTSTRQPGSNQSVAAVNNGIQQAYAAKREAGDKLSSNGIRPATRSKIQSRQAQTQEQPEAQQPQNFAPGSVQSLEAAINLAKTGGGLQAAGQTGSLSEMVNAVKARNAMQASAVPSMDASVSEQPVVKKTRFTTNIPQGKNSKKKNDAIRLLNVDNVSINSKQGAGLAAYHAQQEAAQARGMNQPVQSAQAVEAAQAQAGPISPLTAADAHGANQGSANYAIPPLKPADIKSL